MSIDRFKRHWVLWFAAAMMGLGLATLGPMDSAESVPPPPRIKGCDSKVRLQAAPWTQKYRYTTPFPSGFYPSRTHEMGQTATVAYWYCPNHYKTTDNYRKIKAKWVEYCAFFMSARDEEHRFYDGTRFDSLIVDSSDRWSDPPKVRVKDDGTRQNCRRVDIGEDEEIWMKMRDHPRFRVSSQIIRNNLPDDSPIQWRNGDIGWLFIQPGYDVVLGKWMGR